VTAEGIAFDPKAIAGTAKKPLTIAFVNKDASIPHDIEVTDGSGKLLFEGATITGVNSTVYSVPPLDSGTYKFSCKWHPNMVGELTVK
jgi:plastocyanin